MRFFLRSSSIGALHIPLKTSSKCKKRLAPRSREIEGNRLLKLTEIRIADDFSFMREGHIGSVPVEHYFFVLHKSWLQKLLKKTICSFGALEPLLKKNAPIVDLSDTNMQITTSWCQNENNFYFLNFKHFFLVL